MFFVYKITNLINGKIYIGKASDVQNRWLKHLAIAKYKTANDYSYIHRAINKYGEDNFTIETISGYQTEEEALFQEISHIALYETQNREIGYNLTAGGDGLSGYKHSEESKEKNRQSHIGKIASPETREKMSLAHIGSQHSLETIYKMKVARAQQEPISEETKSKISNAHKGKKLTEEHKNNISKNSSKILTEKHVIQIIELLNYGESLVNIGQKFGVSAGTISSIKSGTKWNRFHHLVKITNRPKPTWPPNDQLLKMVKETNYSKVGRQLGVSGVAVKKRLNRTP